MNWKPLVLGLVLLDFAAFTVYAVFQHGYVGFFELAMANSATQLMFFDLTIALTLFMVWMWSDARERSIGFWPYAALTLLLGSAGPLAYLIRRETAAVRVEHAIPHRATA